MRLRISVQFRPRGLGGQFVPVVVTPAVRAGIQEAAEMIRDRAKQFCPVDTGALQDSITAEIDEAGSTIIGRVAPHMPYAPYVEFGTGIRGASSPGAGEGPYSATWPGMPAQPYMRPALDEGRDDAIFILGQNVGAALK